MLGIGKPKNRVEFSAHGKHPAFNDYFSLNTASPLLNALSSWIEKGVKEESRYPKVSGIHAYRFWMQGGKNEELVLGIIRDSSDSLGRTYPLLIMGKGRVKKWNKNWNYIFSDFEAVFRAFENLSASRYERFKEFETRLTNIRFPRILSPEIVPMDQNGSTGLSKSMMAWFRENREKEAISLPIPELLSRFSSYADERDESRLFKKKVETPAAVFLGGLPDRPVLAIYNRPLKTGDFCCLFNPSKTNGVTMSDQRNKGAGPDGY